MGSLGRETPLPGKGLRGPEVMGPEEPGQFLGDAVARQGPRNLSTGYGSVEPMPVSRPARCTAAAAIID